MPAVELAADVVVGARYRLERQLGEGGMGVVWAAEELGTGELHALKVMKDVDDDPDARRRFVNEAGAAQAVRHPNVVNIFGVLELENGRPAIAMELLEGETLREVLAREVRLSLVELAGILVPVISAVGAAHALGIVHRDLKPENIFLARGAAGGVVKILDFGIAKVTALDGETMRTTGLTTGKVLGTPAYMAPEQVYGQTDLDHRVDVWALGLICYQGLSGTLPTQGDNIGQVFRNVTARPFPPLEELVPDVPGQLSELIARMLARERAERPGDLREVLEVFQQLSATPLTEEQRFGPPAPPLLAMATRSGAVTISPAPGRAAMTAPMSPGASAPRRRWTQRRALGATALTTLLGLLGAALVITLRAEEPHRGAHAPGAAAGSPLASPSTKLACPILRTSGADAPAGWLGAAAAAIACERARLLLGGRTERTMVPAELLDLPRGPSDAFPRDPYGQEGARDRSVTAARQRAAAYLDGEVAWSLAGFEIALSLHRSDGTELARASGRGRGLHEAVRAAMTPLLHAELIPRASVLEPQIAAWARTADPDAALGVLDLAFAFANNAGGLPDECRRFAELGSRTGELGPEGVWQCAYTLGRPEPKVTLDDADGSPAGVGTRIRIHHLIHRTAEPGAAQRLHALLAQEQAPRGRSLLAATESCLIGATDPKAARDLAIAAVQSEPRNPEGGLCNPWEQLMTLERDDMGADATRHAMQAWLPWNSYAWLEAGFGSGGREPATLPMLRRAYLLSPFDAQIADTLARAYLASGDRAATRGLALALRAGGLPLHQVGSDLLLVGVEASEGRFGAALERAQRGSELSGGDAGWVHFQRFELAWRAFELAVLLGRGRAVADQLIARFLDPQETRLDSHPAAVPMRIPAICALASAPERCFQRFRALEAQLPGGISGDTKALLLGAEHYVKGNFTRASDAWRPLLDGDLALASALPDAMVAAFERTGAVELAERVDAEVMKRAGEFHGATLGHVRAARRALARGDRARARQLAEQVLDAWALADEPPPALAEMRRLAASLAD